MINEKELAAMLREYARKSYASRRDSRDGCQCFCNPQGDIENAFEELASMLEEHPTPETVTITNCAAYAKDGKLHSLSCAIHNGVSECSCSVAGEDK